MFVRLAKKIYKLFAILRRHYYCRALFHGVAAGVEHERILHLLDCRTVVDVGANRGQFALVCRHCFPKASIISFEPLAGPLRKFKHIFRGDNNIVIYQVALAHHYGEQIIHVSGHDDSSSLLPIMPLQNALFPGTGEKNTALIEVGPLGRYISREMIAAPALLKLDVQGYELEALKGCEEFLEKFVYIYVECSFIELYSGQALAGQVVTWLHERNYRLRGIYNLSYDGNGEAVQGDFMFIKAGDYSVNTTAT
jgi:FkbM family methyltransferase